MSNSCASKSVCCEASNVIDDGNSRPVFSQHGLTEGIDLAEKLCLKPGPSGGEAEATDSAEEIDMDALAHASPTRFHRRTALSNIPICMALRLPTRPPPPPPEP